MSFPRLGFDQVARKLLGHPDAGGGDSHGDLCILAKGAEQGKGGLITGTMWMHKGNRGYS